MPEIYLNDIFKTATCNEDLLDSIFENLIRRYSDINKPFSNVLQKLIKQEDDRKFHFLLATEVMLATYYLSILPENNDIKYDFLIQTKSSEYFSIIKKEFMVESRPQKILVSPELYKQRMDIYSNY